MGKIDWRKLLWGRGIGWSMPRDSAVTKPDRGVDTALIIEAARLVVTTRVATAVSLERHLFVAPPVADQLLARLEHCEVVGPAQPGGRRPVLTTSAELPGVVDEFRRRGEGDPVI